MFNKNNETIEKGIKRTHLPHIRFYIKIRDADEFLTILLLEDTLLMED